MNRRAAIRRLATIFLTTASLADAQQAKKIPWIGYLAGGGSGPSPAFLQGLRDLGYTEGKNIGIIFRTAEGRRERYSELAAELIRLKVAVIVTDTTGLARALKNATSTIPIVMTSSTDPVGTGLIASYARPGGNVTGLTNIGAEIGGKVLELLKETVPRLAHVAILSEASETDKLFRKEVEAPARALKLRVLSVAIPGPDDIDGAFREMTKQRVNGFLMRLQPSLYSSHFKRVAELAIKNRLPSIAQVPAWPDAGGLMAYGSDLHAQYRRAAVFVDKILKGTKPEDRPVEAPMKFEFVINRQTAEKIGLTIPPDLLARATKIIR